MANAKNSDEDVKPDPTPAAPAPAEPDQPKESALKEDDKVPGKVEGDAELVDPPVRSSRPDVPIVQTLKVGAGQHTPPDPDQYDSDGRPKGVEVE